MTPLGGAVIRTAARSRSVKNAADARLGSTSPSTGVFQGPFVRTTAPLSGCYLATLYNINQTVSGLFLTNCGLLLAVLKRCICFLGHR